MRVLQIISTATVSILGIGVCAIAAVSVWMYLFDKLLRVADMHRDFVEWWWNYRRKATANPSGAKPSKETL